jgi:uncharacterized protein (DUF4415 family)
MRDEYDFSTSKPNPYTKALKREIKLDIDEDSLVYFQNLSAELGMPYQNLINNYLRNCVERQQKPTINWN